MTVYREPPEPEVAANGVPLCAVSSCQHFDSKRCELLGFRPHMICEPAVVEMAAELAELRKVEP